MRSQSVVLLIVLVAIGMSNAFEFTNFAEVKELRQSQYGNSLVETVSLALKNRGSPKDIIKLLRDLIQDLKNQQKKADADWAVESKRLLDKIAELKEEIEKLAEEIDSKEQEREKYRGLLEQGLKNLEQYKKQLSNNIQELKSLAEKRQKDHEEYVQSQSDHSDVINAIQEVLKELSKLIGSVSGKDRPDHVKEIAEETRDRLQKSFVQVTRDEEEANLFVEMATQADQKALLKLIGLLKKLLNSTKKSQDDDEAQEERSAKMYNKLKKSLEEDNEKLKDMIEEQQKNVKEYREIIAKLTAEIKNLKKLKKEKEVLKEQTEKEYQRKLKQYNKDKAERKEERRVIRRLIRIVKTRLARMSQFLTGGNH